MITTRPPRGRFAGLLFFLGMTLATAGLAQQNAEPVRGPLSLAELGK